MLCDVAIRVHNLGKSYQVHQRPFERLKRLILPSLRNSVNGHCSGSDQEFWALHDISFDINRGETVGIIGRNGSGKSTLLQLICGTLNPTCGDVLTFGRIAAILELGAGFNPEFSGRENLYLNAAIIGVSAEEIHERIDDVIEFSGLREHIDLPLKTYSSGMYARLAFSSAINVEPSILIVDEALSVGDAGFQLKCMLRMKRMQEDGVTILFVSHDTSSIIRLCNSAIVLEGGKIASDERDPLKCVKLYEQLTRKVLIPNASEKRLPPSGVIRTYEHELQGIQETRLGSQEARFLNVEFLDDDNLARSTFFSGEEIQIKATIESSKDFSQIVTGMTLKNRVGLDVWGDNNLYAGIDLSLECGISVLTYRFKLQIPEGEYFLYIGLADISEGRVELDQRWPVRRLTVVSKRRCLGYAYSPAGIELTRG
jgi:lipopolysaccharide transport system ATP-binding protein